MPISLHDALIGRSVIFGVCLIAFFVGLWCDRKAFRKRINKLGHPDYCVKCRHHLVAHELKCDVVGCECRGFIGLSQFGPHEFMFSEEDLDKVPTVPVAGNPPFYCTHCRQYLITKEMKEVVQAAGALAYAAHTYISLEQIPSVIIHRLWDAVRTYEESK